MGSLVLQSPELHSTIYILPQRFYIYLEHAVYQLRDVIVGEASGPRDLHQGSQHFGQLLLIYDSVAVLVAHVEDDPQLVLGLPS